MTVRSLISLISIRTHDGSDTTWGSLKKRHKEFNAKSSNIKTIFVGYCMRCKEYYKSRNEKATKAKYVHRKFLISKDRRHIAIYQTTKYCMGPKIPSSYLPMRGFKVDDNINIKQTISVKGNNKVMVNKLISGGMDQTKVTKRLNNIKKSLKKRHSKETI